MRDFVSSAAERLLLKLINIGIFIDANLKQMALPMPLEAPVTRIYFILIPTSIINWYKGTNNN
jgi:hypothetical protein